MVDPLRSASAIASMGMEAQSTRLRVISENLANSQSTGKTPGSDPYQRKVVTFEAVLEELTGQNSVRVAAVSNSDAPFPTILDPDHPAADASGVVKIPNVNVLMEMADMREASRTFEANLQVIKQARELNQITIDLLRSGT